MTSEAPYLHCRLCGTRYRSDKVFDHEKQCSLKTSRPQDKSPSSRNAKNERAPLSSRESGVNELRDKEEYYMKATKSSDSSVNLPDPKSNEESYDSPLKNMSAPKRYQTTTTKTIKKSKPRNSSRNSKEDSTPDSTEDSGINEIEEEYYTQSERSPKSSAIQPKNSKSNEESMDSPLKNRSATNGYQTKTTKTYSSSKPRNSSRNSKEDSTPDSTKDSGTNEIEEEYYKQSERSSKSSANQPKNPKSNEKSNNSPFKNRSATNRYQTETTKTYSSSKPRNSSRNSKEDSAPDSTKDGGTNEEEYYTQSERSSKSSANQPKNSKSNEKSNNSPVTPNRKGARGSRERQDEPTESQGRKEAVAWEVPSDDVSRAVGQSKGKSPPKLSSSRKKSNSNENTPVKVNPGKKGSKERASPKKSNEEQKEEMMRTPYPSEEDIRVPSTNTEEVDDVTDFIENLPELTEKNMTAYERHQASLVPCAHCERTFRPDRLPVHEGSCPQRPEARKYSVFKDEGKHGNKKSPK